VLAVADWADRRPPPSLAASRVGRLPSISSGLGSRGRWRSYSRHSCRIRDLFRLLRPVVTVGSGEGMVILRPSKEQADSARERLEPDCRVDL
jgi:hypothetical protein